ncbi:MAG: S1 RNA-binding domain-containing protein [Candidatus Vogelbacteria bacterium]|nr:S1 RNA-binding domain-containing protein [Candidatus Vogelbacteria bacterium]
MNTDTITSTALASETTGTRPDRQKGVEKNERMEQILKDAPLPPAPGDLAVGRVIGHDKLTLYINLEPFGTGIIFGREYLGTRDLIKKIKIGDEITAKVIEGENENGYVELSLKEARQAVIWKDAEQAIKEKRILELSIKDANKGGLLIEWQGILGFLPASQLSSDHYPRVADGDKDKIMEELKKLIGKTISVSIITADPKEEKIIFSEKAGNEQDKHEIIAKYNLGDVLSGTVTGVVDFGVFLKLEEGLEGLVHISEIDWSLVDDPKTRFKVGDSVQVKVIEIKDSKISLSIKALKENPWKKAAERYNKGAEVSGVVIKYNRHGALVSIEEGIAGLVHVSEFASPEELRQTLELGKTYRFTINLFDPKEQRMTLSYITQ